MIRLPQNVNELRGEQITLRFKSAEECGYIMLFEAGTAKLAQRMIALDENAEEAVQAALAEHNASRFVDGQGQHCLIMTVGDAISLVSPIEQIKQLSRRGVPVTAHKFSTEQVYEAASEVLGRFERTIEQISEAARSPDSDGIFLQAPGGMQ